ncbi:MAG TPA: DUF1579 family protein [Cyclobacteriaceae bacterium]|nr:DUF1579 family protein [Cyclobacteriaceae bacterium]
MKYHKTTTLTTLVLISVLTSKGQGDTYNQLLDYSRPGKYHELLAMTSGEWTWEGKRFSGHVNPDSNKVLMNISGTLSRKPFANGRFFIAEQISSGKLESPIQDGRMLKDNYRNVTLEGYDNVKKKFVRAVINNHLGSGIELHFGTYDSTSHTISFDSEVELLPNMRSKQRERLILIDNDHYKQQLFDAVTNVMTDETLFTRIQKNSVRPRKYNSVH